MQYLVLLFLCFLPLRALTQNQISSSNTIEELPVILNENKTRTSNEIIHLTVDVCDNGKNGYETLDLSAYQSLILSNSNINTPQYFRLDGSCISNPYYFTITGNTTVEVRQKNTNGTYDIVQLHLMFQDAVEAVDIIQYFCDEVPYNYEVINIIDLIYQKMPNLQVDNIELYLSQSAAQTQNSALQVLDLENYELTQHVIIMYLRFEAEGKCPSITQLALKLKSVPSPVVDAVEICDAGNNGSETITLSDYTYQVFGTMSYTVRYYNTENDALAETNPISQKTISPTNNTVFYTAKNCGVLTCEGTGSLVFDLNSGNAVNDTSVNLCDNLLDGSEIVNLTDYNSLVEPSVNNAEIFYFSTEADANNGQNHITNTSNYEITTGASNVWARIKTDEGCDKVVRVHFNFNTNSTTQDYAVSINDNNADNVETVNLNSMIQNVVTVTNEIQVLYYTDYNSAVNNANNHITNPESFVAHGPQETVYVRVENTNTTCYTVAEIQITLIATLQVNNAVIEICDEDGDGMQTVELSSLNAYVIENESNYTFQYYNTMANAEAQINALNINTPVNVYLETCSLYARVSNTEGQYGIAHISFATSASSASQIPAGTVLELCDADNDGIETFDLSEINSYIPATMDYSIAYYHSLEEAINQNNAITNVENYTNTAANETIYVRIQEADKCAIIENFEIQVTNLGESPLEIFYEKCLGSSITLDAGEADTYLWSTGETTRYITVDFPDRYEVTVATNSGCEATYVTHIKDLPIVNLSYETVAVGSIELHVNGYGTYEYSLDGENWQASTSFTGLENGTYIAYARDTQTGCIGQLEINLLVYGTLLSNGRGAQNQTWRQCGLENFGTGMSQLVIYDNMGTSVYKQQSNTCFEWDGTSNGQTLPNGNYYYKIALANGNVLNGTIAIRGSVR